MVHMRGAAQRAAVAVAEVPQPGGYFCRVSDRIVGGEQHRVLPAGLLRGEAYGGQSADDYLPRGGVAAQVAAISNEPYRVGTCSIIGMDGVLLRAAVIDARGGVTEIPLPPRYLLVAAGGAQVGERYHAAGTAAAMVHERRHGRGFNGDGALLTARASMAVGNRQDDLENTCHGIAVAYVRRSRECYRLRGAVAEVPQPGGDIAVDGMAQVSERHRPAKAVIGRS